MTLAIGAGAATATLETPPVMLHADGPAPTVHEGGQQVVEVRVEPVRRALVGAGAATATLGTTPVTPRVDLPEPTAHEALADVVEEDVVDVLKELELQLHEANTCTRHGDATCELCSLPSFLLNFLLLESMLRA